MTKKGKIIHNNEYIVKQLERGREHIFKNNAPYPSCIGRSDHILAVHNRVIYLKSSSIETRGK